jgi:hypothetical protein
VDERDAPFIDLMVSISMEESSRTKPAPRSIVEIGPDLDFLADICFARDFSPLQLAAFAMHSRRNPTKRVAIVISVRDEGIYVLEWLAYHRILGAEQVFMYTNDNCDGSDQLLQELASKGLITLIRNSCVEGANFQRKAYQHAILLLNELRDFRWVFFLDCDEFLNFHPNFEGALPAFVCKMEREMQNNLPGAAIFPWSWRLTDRPFQRDDISLLGHYQHACLHRLFKPLVNLQSTLSMCEIHVPTFEGNGFLVDGEMRRIGRNAVWEGVKMPYSGPRIEHFWSKSFIEFLIKKKRGEKLDCCGLQRDLSQFFTWSEVPSAANYAPVSSEWVSKVEEEMQEILSSPAIAEAYSVAVESYRNYVARTSTDPLIRQTYDDLLSTSTPSLGDMLLTSTTTAS